MCLARRGDGESIYSVRTTSPPWEELGTYASPRGSLVANGDTIELAAAGAGPCPVWYVRRALTACQELESTWCRA